MRIVNFTQLSTADLIVDATYQSNRDDRRMTYGSEPLHHLLPGIGNQGGFRKRKGLGDDLVGLVLTSNRSEQDWPDHLDVFTGTYTYYGDNRVPGQDLHDTRRGGNLDLSRIFGLAHGGVSGRLRCPLILVFESGTRGRDMTFLGLAVPGTNYLAPGEDLLAIWKSKNGQRFQNYRAEFTILNAGVISGAWIREVFTTRRLDLDDPRAPKAYVEWVRFGRYEPLQTEAVDSVRPFQEQLPREGLETEIIETILHECGADPFRFEVLAAEIWRLSCRSFIEYDLTRKYRDGGRDATGSLLIGPPTDPVRLPFALEAKCYRGPATRVGVKDTSRLISRIKHRDFGVLVTTSGVNKQAYEEIRSDNHPVVIISGRDIATILIQNGRDSARAVQSWMESLQDPR